MGSKCKDFYKHWNTAQKNPTLKWAFSSVVFGQLGQRLLGTCCGLWDPRLGFGDPWTRVRITHMWHHQENYMQKSNPLSFSAFTAREPMEATGAINTCKRRISKKTQGWKVCSVTDERCDSIPSLWIWFDKTLTWMQNKPQGTSNGEFGFPLPLQSKPVFKSCQVQATELKPHGTTWSRNCMKLLLAGSFNGGLGPFRIHLTRNQNREHQALIFILQHTREIILFCIV